MNKTEKEFSHLFHQFPNCRFIFRLYSKFKFEVLADYEKYQELNELINKMKIGSSVAKDDAYVFGILQFPLLPIQLKEKTDSVFINPSSEVYNSGTQLPDFHQLNEQQFNGEQLHAIKEKIEDITFPGVTIRQAVVICLFVFGYLIPILILLLIFPNVQNNMETPLTFIHSMGGLHFYTYSIPSFSYRYGMEYLHFYNEIKMFEEFKNQTLPHSLGNTFDTKEQLTFLIQRSYLNSF